MSASEGASGLGQGSSGEHPDASGCVDGQVLALPPGAPSGWDNQTTGPLRITVAGSGVHSIVVKTSENPAGSRGQRQQRPKLAEECPDAASYSKPNAAPTDPVGEVAARKPRFEFTLPSALEPDFRHVAEVAREQLAMDDAELRNMGIAIRFVADNPDWRALIAKLAATPAAYESASVMCGDVISLVDSSQKDAIRRMQHFVAQLLRDAKGVVVWYDESCAANLRSLGNNVLDCPGLRGRAIRWALQRAFPRFKWLQAEQRRARQRHELEDQKRRRALSAGERGA